MRFKRLLGIGLSLAIVASVLPLQVIADEITDALKCRSVSEASYSVQENVITEWPGHANIEIVFTNTGDEPIFNWNYSFEFIYNIESPYNCMVLEHDGDLYTIGNSGWNKDIYPGESVTIGFTASSNDGSDIEYMPSFYLLNNAKTTLPEGALSVEYVEYSDWTSGSSGALILTNNTEESIKRWEISFAANRPITDAYNVTLTTNEDGTYTITGDSYSEIPAGGTYQFGIQCGEHDSGIPFEITGLTVSSSTLALGLTDDQNGNGVPDVAETDYTGIVPTATPDITDTPAPTTTEEPTVTVEPTITETPTDTPEPTPTGIVLNPDEDLDEDGLANSEEEMLGTDPYNPDTDSDGVSDGNEIWMFYYPTMEDSDLNGVLDGDEDYDLDGLSNRDEEFYGTYPWAEDSDFDGIKDYDEIFVYFTDPNNADTDGDCILDGDEIVIGLDPISATTDGIIDNENTNDWSFSSESEPISWFNADDQPFSFSFDITAAGRVDKYIKVQETGYKYAIEDNSTILGRSPEILYDDAMKVDAVTVRFTLNDGYDDSIDKYNVFYYWEGYNILIPIETEYDYDSGTVYATNSMIGTYCLVDTEQMYDLLGIEESTVNNPSFVSDYPAYNLLGSSESTDIEYSTSSVYEFNGHEYVLLVADTAMSYSDAIAVCAKEGGYPAVITSDEENGFLYDLRGGLFASCWLGGLVIREGNNRPTVQWITGEECVYDCWAVLYSGGVEGTLIQGLIYQMNGWAWVDLETATERRVICERPIGTNPDEEGITISALTFGEEDIELNCYSDSDIDGDGILDYLELSSFDLGTFDDSTGEYTPAKMSNYLLLAESNNINVSAILSSSLGNNTTSSYASDVKSADKDKDDAPDTTDSKPLYIYDIWTMSLGGNEYDFYKPKEDGYISVYKEENSGTVKYYGGRQQWFDFSIFGCGVIATHDVLSYLNNGKYYIYTYDDYYNETQSFKSQLSSDFELFFIARTEYDMPYYSWGPVPPYCICRILNDNNSKVQYAEYSLDGSEDNRNDALYRIVDSLLEDCPVIVFSVGLNLQSFEYNNETGVWTSDTTDLNVFEWHYVTITGIIVFQGELFLKVQSWGGVYYVKYDDLFGSINKMYCPE